MDPYSTKRPFNRPGQTAQRWNSYASSPNTGTWTASSLSTIDVPERVLYRVCQYVNDNPVLLKDFNDRTQAPRVLLFKNADPGSIAHDENGRVTTLDDLTLHVLDEVLVSQYKPWRSARGTEMQAPDAPIRVSMQNRMITPHAEATIIWLSKRVPTKRCVSFIEKRRQFGKERESGKVHLRTDVIDPANLRSTLVTAQKAYEKEMILKAFRYTGLPVYLDYAVLPKGVCVDAFRGIYSPAESAPWFEGIDFKRHPHGLSVVSKISPVEYDSNRPVQEVRRLADPFSVPVPDQMQAIEEHEQAIASSIVLAYQHLWNEASLHAHVLEGVTWREEKTNIVLEYGTNLPWTELSDENRKTLTSLAKTYVTGTQVSVQKMVIQEATDEATGEIARKFEPERSAISRFTVDNVVAEESGRFQIRLLGDSTVSALHDFRCTDINELTNHAYQIRPTTSQTIPKGIAHEFYNGRISALLRNADDPDGKMAPLEKEKAETLKAFLGGGTYDESERLDETIEKHIEAMNLNREQKDAIRAFFDACRAAGIQAPAGTGKTTVIVHALLVHYIMAIAEEVRFREESNKAIRQRWGVDAGPYTPPTPPQFDTWVLTSASNAAVTNMIRAALRLCGKQLKMVVLMSTTALRKQGENVPWQTHLLPSLINSCYSEHEMWRLNAGERQIFAAAMDICASRYSFMGNLNWITLANEERAQGNDATILNEALRIIVRQYRPMVVFGTTSLVLRHIEGLARARTFVVDEASTSPEVAILAALLRAAAPKKSVQVGDVTQLHVFEGNLHERNKKIAFRSALKTLIERSNAQHGQRPTNMHLVHLQESHRFHPKICAFLAELFYPGLRPGPRSTEKTLLTNSKFPLIIKDTPMVAINIIEGRQERNVTMSFRVREHTEAVVELVQALRVLAPRVRIGIACFYNAQRDQIRAAGLESVGVLHRDIISADVAQGLEYDVIIIVPSRTEGLKETEPFLDSWERLCVAFSRGGSGIIVLGNLTQLQVAPNWKRLLDVFREYAPLRSNEYLDELLHKAKLEKEAQAASTPIENAPTDNSFQADELTTDLEELDPPSLAVEHQLEQRVSTFAHPTIGRHSYAYAKPSIPGP